MNIVRDFIRHMRLREQGGALREFAKSKELSARSFADIAKNLQQAMDEGKVSEEELLSLFLNRSTFGHKRAILLKEAPADPASLGESNPGIVNIFPVTGRSATRPVSGKNPMPGFYAGSRKADGIEVHTFVTARNVNLSEEVESDSLTEEGQKLYEGAKIVAKRGESIRCFDQLVKVEGRWVLLVDRPPTVDREECSADVSLYRRRLEQEFGGHPFVDLWPTVKAIYEDPKEGAINFVRFESNNRAQVAGEYGRLQNHDYRKAPYHAAGSKKGQVLVFAIGVRWIKPEADFPYVALPGKRAMLQRQIVNGEPFPPLHYADFVLPTTEKAFCFAIRRILKRLA